MRHPVALRVVFSILILSVSAFACTRGEIAVNTSPSFTVRVSNDYGPVVGLRILVTYFRVEEYSRAIVDHRSALERSADSMADINENTPNAHSAATRAKAINIGDYIDVIATSITDRKGEAQFHLNTTGSFALKADHPEKADNPETGIGDIVLNVSGDAASAVVDVKWPGTPILETTSLKGHIEDGLFKPTSEALREANVSLRELVSYKEIAQTETSGAGSFQFSSIPPGLYLLKVKAKEDDPNAPNGDIAVLVKPGAPRDSLSIAVRQSDCGLSYDLVENKSRYKPIVCVKAGKQVPCPY